LVFELAKRHVAPLPSEPAAYRALVRAQMVDPNLRARRSRKWKRWERAAATYLWHRRQGVDRDRRSFADVCLRAGDGP
jgi:hypothetical protein